MDTGRGTLALISERRYKELQLKKANGLFKVGEVVEIHGSAFNLESIAEDGTIVLKLKISAESVFDEMTEHLKNTEEQVDIKK